LITTQQHEREKEPSIVSDVTTFPHSLPVATSATSAGKQYRLGRLFADDGRTVILPVDHGSMLGRVSGLEDPAALMEQFLPLACDGFLLGPGLATRTSALFARRAAPARLLTIDTYWRGEAVGEHVLMTSLARAGILGVDGVKVLMPWDVSPGERAARSDLIAKVIIAAEDYGLPVMVEPIFLGAPRAADAVAIEADGCRMAAELGADIIKVAYPGDPDVLAAWCSELRLPVVILGGPAGGSIDDLCTMVKESIAAGARGITIGRRVWQRPIEEAAELLGQLAGIVHDGSSV
jgi:class I fructose-bisphosphate aldolase